ncbi:MAG: hypothetical protein CM1200mP40_03830 [Gammaproteobacteria bacterium]|nr:MAG: hypothetical protein CM1200mP40_03830 [Gammaproteobacteria bacterium]
MPKLSVASRSRGRVIGNDVYRVCRRAENIDEIITVPGLGAIFIGPSDLNTSMGYASPAAPQVEEAIQRVLRACLDNDVPFAITTGPSSVQQRIEGKGLVS